MCFFFLVLSFTHSTPTKAAPERWQDEKSRRYDVAVTYEERVFDALVEDMESRKCASHQPLHVLGLDVRDNHKEAALGAEQTVLLVEMIRAAGPEWEDKLESILDQFESQTGRAVTHSICFY